jgi:hypothetical protein
MSQAGAMDEFSHLKDESPGVLDSSGEELHQLHARSGQRPIPSAVRDTKP